MDKSKTYLEEARQDFTQLNKTLIEFKSRDLTPHFEKLIALKNNLLAFQKQSEVCREQFTLFTKQLEDLERICSLHQAYKEYIEEMKRRVVFHNRLDKKVSEVTAYFDRMSKNENAIRIS